MLTLSKSSALTQLQPMAQEVEQQNTPPPVINTYTPQVEKWRQQIWDQMPQQLKSRPDAATLLDKSLYVIGGPSSRNSGADYSSTGVGSDYSNGNGESNGNENAVGDGGSAWGLFQSHHIPAGSDPAAQINDFWRMVSNNPDQFTDWGEGALYEGKPFGVLGAHPYNGGAGAVGNSALQTLPGAQPPKPLINYTKPQQLPDFNTDTQGLPAITSGAPTGQLPSFSAGGNSIGSQFTNPVNLETGGVDQPYGPRDTTYGQDFIDAPSGSPRAALEDVRQGKDQLGNAALAGATALPLIGAGPISAAAGVIGGEVGQYVDEKLGLPQVNLPILGKVGPATLAGGLLGGIGDSGEGIAGGTVRNPTVRPNLRVIQPGERPGMLSVVGKNQPDPVDFIRRAREIGMSDEEIRQAFPGALEKAGGIDVGPQRTARLDTEQAAKGAAAKRTYERIFAQHVEDLKAEGYSDAEAKQIATGLASREARRAAGAAPEVLPEQKPNVLATDETRTAMQEAQDKLRGGNQAVETPSGIPYDKPTDALTAEADKLGRIGGTGRSSTDQTIADVATAAKRIGDPASEVRRQLQGQGKSQLQKVIDEEQQGKDHPDQLVPPEQLNMLDEVLGQMSMQDEVRPGPGPTLKSPESTYEFKGGKLDAASVAERARLSTEYAKNTGGPQLSEAEFRQEWNNIKTARDGGRRWPENWTQDKINAYLKLEQGLTGDTVSGAVGQDVTSGLFPGPLFEAGDVPPSVEPSVRPGAGQTLRERQAAQEFEQSQRLARQRLEQAAAKPDTTFQGTGEVVEAAKNLKPDQQASLLNKDWEPGKSIAQNAARAMSDLISLPRSLQTRFDFSYPFRQGLLFVRRQGEFWDAFGTGLQSLWKDEDWKRAVEAEYMNAPYNPQTLKITKWSGGNMAEREELFYNRLLDKFPAPMRKVFDASEEAATIFINKLRSDVTNNVARKWLRNGLEATDPEFIQDLNIFGNYVNRATGYGNLGELEKSVGALNTVFYGARRNVAMVQAPGYLFNSSARVRVEAWKDFMGLFGLGASTLGLAQLAGIGDVNTFNPDSADWGKLKVGGTRLDIWSGYQQTARLVYKIASGEMKDPGDLSVFWKNVLPYLGNKLSPQAGAAVSTMPEGVKRVIQPVDRPFKLTDALAPLAWSGLVQAIKEDGAVAGAIAATGLVGMGSQTYQSQTDVRDKEAQTQFKTDYENLTPVQRQAVNKSEAVTKYQQENSSQYKESKDRLLAPINQEEKQAEQAFKEGKLSKPLPDIWHEEGIKRQQVAKDLADQFKDMFDGFDKSRYDNAVQGYYGRQVLGPDGQIDFDATEAARQDYIKTLKLDEQQWLDEALQVSRESKSPAHQKYLKYIDERKKAGYFDIKPDDPDRAKKLVELDRKNPLQDALNWYWKGGTQDTTRVPALNSPTAVEYALQMDPKRPAKFAGLDRAINSSPGALQVWRDYAPRIDNYYTKSVDAYKDQESQRLYDSSYDRLDQVKKNAVASSILTQVRAGSPELEAVLQYLGDVKNANGEYIVSKAAEPYLLQMLQKYGSEPPKPGTKFMVRQ